MKPILPLVTLALSGCSAEGLASFAEILGDESKAHFIRLTDNANHVSDGLGKPFSNLSENDFTPVAPNTLVGSASFKGFITVPTQSPDQVLGTMTMAVNFGANTASATADNFSAYSGLNSSLSDGKVTEVFSGTLNLRNGTTGDANGVMAVLGDFEGTLTGPKSGTHVYKTDINGFVGRVNSTGLLTIGGGLVGTYRHNGNTVNVPDIDPTKNSLILTQ